MKKFKKSVLMMMMLFALGAFTLNSCNGGEEANEDGEENTEESSEESEDDHDHPEGEHPN